MLWEHRLTVLCTGESHATVVTSFYVMGGLMLPGHCVESSRPWELPYTSCSLETTSTTKTKTRQCIYFERSGYPSSLILLQESRVFFNVFYTLVIYRKRDTI